MRALATLLTLALLVSCASKPEQHSVKAATPEPASDPAHPTLAQQKMCAEQAKKAFDDDEQRSRQSGSKGTLSDYTSHFDPEKNICYVRINSISATVISTIVYDAFERRLFASYGWVNANGKKFWEVKPMECKVLPPKIEPITCQSDDEFNALVEKWFGVSE
jgi:hypothetical protein